MFGKGLLTGMGITWKHFWGKKSTVCYPEEKLPMTEKYAERLKQALEDAEEIYIESSLYAAERDRAEIISFDSVKKNDQNSR